MLREAAVSAYSPLLSPEQIAATLWSPDSLLVDGFGSADLAPALNALPGVLMETRGAGGSRRLNIRDLPCAPHLRFATPCCLFVASC